MNIKLIQLTPTVPLSKLARSPHRLVDILGNTPAMSPKLVYIGELHDLLLRLELLDDRHEAKHLQWISEAGSISVKTVGSI